MQEADTEYLTTSDAARQLQISPDRVRQLARSGELKAAIVTKSGQRLYSRDEVDRYVAASAARRRGAA